MESWRKNLYVIAVAEFVVLIGFNSVSPFLPLFIQTLGNYNSEQAAFWAGIATGISGIATFSTAPLWGLIADRWGRKPMLLRAQFGAAAVLILAGFSPNVYFLIGCRFAQGVLAGTVPAASALVASTTSREKIPFAMGLLLIAVYGGNALGPLVGGFISDVVGYQITFFITGFLLFLGGILVLFFVKEDFKRVPSSQRTSLKDALHLAISKEVLPLLFILCMINIGPQMISPIIPLLIKSFTTEGQAGMSSGIAFALMSFAAAISAFIASRLARTVSLINILVFSCIGTGLLYLPPLWARNPTQLVFLVGVTGLLIGGIITASSSLVSFSVPVSRQGIAYGLSQSANALGSGIGPLLGGSLAQIIGLKPVFAVTAGLFVIVGLITMKMIAGKRDPI